MAAETEILPSGLSEKSLSGDASGGEEVSNGQGNTTEGKDELLMDIEILPANETENRGEERSFAEITDQMNPMSPLKAVQLSGEHDNLMSDDETPRVLTTLEPVKKQQENEKQIVIKEVTIPQNSSDDPGSIAKKQLETLNSLKRKGRPKADDPKPIDRIMAHINEKKSKIQILENKVVSPPPSREVYSGLKEIGHRKNLHSNILTKEEISREIIQKCRKSNVRIERVSAKSSTKGITGTIEIPEELIHSEDDTQPILVHETESLEGQDLLAILEGDDDEDETQESVYEIQTTNPSGRSGDDVHVEEYTIALITDPNKQKELDKDKEIEIAMKQIMSLPVKPKGRRSKKATIQVETSKPMQETSKPTSASDLVSSLVSDWSDNEDKMEEMNEDNILIIKKEVAPVAKAASPVQKISPPPLKSSRIIKKKVIWDPDAPETQISYASKIQPASTSKASSSSSSSEKVVVKRGGTPKVLVVEEKSSVLPTVKEVKQKRPGSAGSVGAASATKKKRVTEVDRLLGDEGAVNMLYELERENNNSEVPEIVTKPDKNLMISKSKEKNALVAKAKAVRNLVINKTDTPQRGRPKREVTPFQISPPTAPAAQTKKTTPAKKRSAKDSAASSSASDSWDFLYSSAQGDDSMIIRRRSNSSYSGSTTSPRRLSIDQHQEDGSRRSSSSFEFAKPVDKKTPKVDPSTTQNLVAELKGKLNQAISRGNVTISKNSSDSAKTVKADVKKPVVIAKIAKDSTVKLRASERKLGDVEFKEITIRRYDNFVQLIFSPTFGTLKNVLTIGLLREVKTALNLLKEDTKCKLVLVTSAGSNFCQGIDFSTLLQTTADKRKSSAHQLLNALKDFIESLATFPKPLIAGVHGAVGDLGVMILPLFDVVLSSEAATFYTNYAKIGQIPEANAVLNVTRKVSSKGISLLLFLCETLTARAACEYGLVTKTLWPDNFQDLLMENAKTISSYSLQALEAIKARSRELMTLELGEALAEEHKILLQQWTSAECQEKFKKFLNFEEW